MAAMEYCQKMVKFMPSDAVQWDDASNNRALISDKAALIWNPPSAWAVAKRDAPQVAADCWTFPNPTRTDGPHGAAPAVFLGDLEVREEQDGGQGADRVSVAARTGGAARRAGLGLRYPAVPIDDGPQVWADVEPPKGTIYNYPNRPWHDAEYYVPVPPPRRRSRCRSGTAHLVPGMVGTAVDRTVDQAGIAWGKEELEGFIR